MLGLLTCTAVTVITEKPKSAKQEFGFVSVEMWEMLTHPINYNPDLIGS